MSDFQPGIEIGYNSVSIQRELEFSGLSSISIASSYTEQLDETHDNNV